MQNQKFVVEIRNGKTVPICSLEEHDEKIRADERRKFAEWVMFFIDGYYFKSADEILSVYAEFEEAKKCLENDRAMLIDANKHDSELLDKVAQVVKNRIDSYNPSYTDIYNVITELSDVVLNSIAEIKGNAAE